MHVGDCFEVAMHREKFPEKIPFRLTRMLIKAMEVSGVEGSYRSTCERTMGVLRDSRDSLVAMLEAFVHDPLISWRLLDTSTDENAGEKSAKNVDGDNGRVVETASRLGTSISQGALQHPIQEDVEDDEEGEESVVNNNMIAPIGVANSSIRESISQARAAEVARETAMENNAVATANAAARDRSLQMYNSIQTTAANMSASSRLASITGGGGVGQSERRMVAEGSLALSRRGRSVRQLEAMSLLASDVENDEKEETLNEKALKVIRRVQDKLTGTDFNGPDETGGEPLDVPDQVQRLIVQATSNENLSQLFVGWYVSTQYQCPYEWHDACFGEICKGR
jgi:phosphatidylinositol kinase/protein kinase (PI-3  family)